MCKKLFLVIMLVILIPTFIICEIVKKDEVIEVCIKYLQIDNFAKNLRLNQNDLTVLNVKELVHKDTEIGYIINLSPMGFIVTPAITELSPVKFISYKGNFEDIKDHPFIQQILDRIHYTRVKLYNNQKMVYSVSGDQVDGVRMDQNKNMWDDFKQNRVVYSRQSVDGPTPVGAVAPLLTSTWSQGTKTAAGNAYNMYCPTMDSGGVDKHTYTGCSATAMAQVMYFWKYPTTGQSSHSYSWNGETLSANFNHEYYWSRMVNSYNGTQTAQQEDAVARLMSDVGIAINMNYGLSGSGAIPNRNNAFVTFFKYSSDCDFENRSSYANWDAWFDMFKEQMDNGWPAVLATFKPGSGHAVVIDGYRTSLGNQVHVNMGWGGSADNYYSMDDVYGYGNASSDYTIRNIHPPASAGSITLTSPTGGESWKKGSTQNITWSSTGISSGNFSLILYDGSTNLGPIAAKIPYSNNSFSWTVGNLVSGKVNTGTNYKIKIKLLGQSVQDKSSSAFSITASTSASVTLTSATGGESWQKGSTQNITWSSTGIDSGNFSLILYDGSTNLGPIASKISYSTNSFSWTVGNLVSGTADAGTNFKIKIKLLGQSVQDRSSSAFSITTSTSASVTLTSATGGESWQKGSTQNITWSSTGIDSGNFSLILYDGSTNLGPIASKIPYSTNSFSWTVGNLVSGTTDTGTNYKIKIKLLGQSVQDKSSSAFSITASTSASVTLTSATGGESWQKGSTQNITWSSTGIDSGNFRLILYKGSTNLGPIASKIPYSTNSFSWTVGNLVSGTTDAGTNYKIKIKLLGQSVQDKSSSYFTITP